jgi:hypothetical protein
MITRPVFLYGADAACQRLIGGELNVKTTIIAVSAAAFMAAAPVVFAQGLSSKTPAHEVRAKGPKKGPPGREMQARDLKKGHPRASGYAPSETSGSSTDESRKGGY